MNLSFKPSTNPSAHRRIKYFLFIIIIICFSQNLSFSQSKTSSEFGLSGGLSVPTIPDDFSDNCKTGITLSLNAGYTFYFGKILYTLQCIYNHNSFPFDEIKLNKKYTNVRGSASTLWNITFGGKVEHETIPVYCRFGIGFFHLNQGDVAFNNNNLPETFHYPYKIGELLDIGIGLKKKISKRIGFFIEGYGYLAEAFREDTRSYAIISAGGLGIKTGILIILKR